MNIDSGQLWIYIAGLTVVVALGRNVFMILPQRLQPRGSIERALRFAPLAALVALVTPELIAPVAQYSGESLFAFLHSILLDARVPAALTTLFVSRARGGPVSGLLAGGAVYLALLSFSGNWN